MRFSRGGGGLWRFFFVWCKRHVLKKINFPKKKKFSKIEKTKI